MAADLKALAEAAKVAREAWETPRTSETYAVFVAARFDLRNAATPDAILNLIRERDEARFHSLGDNHHNAWACPHCNPEGLTLDDHRRSFLHMRTRAEVAEAALAAMGEREAVAWEHFRDDSYFDLWCVRPTGERAFGVGFHVSTEAEAIALVETLAGKASPRPEAVEGAVKAERERIIAELRRCPHDMGFGREMGPIGCDLDLKEGGCVCMGIAAAIRGGT